MAAFGFGAGVGVATMRGLPDCLWSPMTIMFGPEADACLVDVCAAPLEAGVGQGVGPGTAPLVTLIRELGGAFLGTGVAVGKGLGLVSVILTGGLSGAGRAPRLGVTGGTTVGAPDNETVPRASGGTGM